MEQRSGYVLLEKLDETKVSLIYRGCKNNGVKSYIIKILKPEHLTSEKISMFNREYEITRRFNHDGVIQTVEITKIDHAPAIIMEDIDGLSLAEILRSQTIPLPEILDLAITIAEIIGNIHKLNIIHKDINPTNILWNREKNTVRIIDFGIATELPREITSVKNPNILQGTIAYISPEQTGRMNRALDYRTDFYSFGVTLYRMLTGRLPFESKDPMKLVYSHIAIQPVPPHEINQTIPVALSDIVMKLMAKNEEDRYQSAFGLKADLEQCRLELENTGNITPFELGVKDISDKFQIPQKLYGREQETRDLMAAFERVRDNNTELMLVSGFSGIGKSMLINELQRAIVKHSGCYISGKFERLEKDVPYSAIIQAFTRLAKQILAEDDAEISLWKKKILSALGSNGKIITDILPLFELIIGKQEDVPLLDSVQTQNRFSLVFQSFIKSLVSKEHPLVIFLDDLQWADSASLHLLKLFTTDSDIKYLFMIGAYRQNETPESHPLILTLNEIKKYNTRVSHIFLNPLDTDHINQLLGDTLGRPIEETQPLTELLLRKTRGNPFFVNEFLKSLYKENLIRFSFGDGWSWDMTKIEEIQATDNVVDLMAEQISDLPEPSQDVLKLGACIGSHFMLSTLVTIYKKSEKDILAALNDALQEGMLLRVDDTYRFSHDRVMEAAYSLIPDTEKKHQHYRIGNLELINADQAMIQERIFFIVNQLNAGGDLVTEKAEKRRLAELNLMAGKKALASNAYTSALNYFNMGITLLEENCWQKSYDFTLALYQDAAVAAQLSADYETMDQRAGEIFKNARTILDTINVYEAKIFACVARNHMIEAIRIGLDVLRQLGLNLPENPSKFRIIYELLLTKWSVRGKKVEDLIHLPEIQNPYKRAIAQILTGMGTSAYIALPDFFPLIVLNTVRISVNYGNSIYSPYAYAAFGMIHCGVLGDINTGYEYGKLALNLVEKFNIQATRSRVWMVVWFFVNHWKNPVRNSINPTLEAYKVGLETGDLEFAAYSANVYSICSFNSGEELVNVENELAKYDKTIQKLNQGTSLNFQRILHQAVLNLRGFSENPCRLTGSAYDENTMLPVHKKANDLNAIFNVYFYLLYLNYTFENYNDALTYSELLKMYSKTQIAHLYLPIINFYDSLTRLALYPTETKANRKRIIKIVTKNQKKLNTWAAHSPQNNTHKYHLVEAELLRVTGNAFTGVHPYTKAIKLAHDHKFLNEEALAQELAAKFWLGKNEGDIAALYIKKAHHSYRLWGAIAKVKHIEEKYSKLLETKHTFFEKTDSTHSVTGNISKGLDLLSIIKSSNAILSVLNIDDLLKRIIEISLENAGATNGVILLKKGNEYRIEAEQKSNGEITVMQSLPLDKTSRLAVSPINYILRTKHYIVLDDAANIGDFTSDPWIKNNQVKSLLVSSILHQGEMLGVFYAENNMAKGVFTKERLDILRVLSTQAAISLKNAQLFESIKQAENDVREMNISLEKRVAERTEKLNQTLEEVNSANQYIMSSIRYSSLIQRSLLPDPDQIKETIPNSFFIWEPRSIIGGDIYYAETWGNNFVIAVIDCTGHGIPGAFMTMIASSGLRRIVNEEANTHPTEILKKLNYIVKTSLQQDKEYSHSDDGLDASVCYYNSDSDVLTFSGARLPLYYITDNELFIIKGDRASLGYVSSDLDFQFTEHTIHHASNSCFYLASDGYMDQLGGDHYTRLGSKILKNLLLENHTKPFDIQKEILCRTYENHMGTHIRTDDVTVVGFRPRK